jgi:hypothetical protein
MPFGRFAASAANWATWAAGPAKIFVYPTLRRSTRAQTKTINKKPLALSCIE